MTTNLDTMCDVALDGSDEFRLPDREGWWHVVGSNDGGRRTLTIRSGDQTKYVSIEQEVAEIRLREVSK